MTYPDNTSLEALWNGPLGETLTRRTFTESSADEYGVKIKTWASAGTTRGRIKVVKPNEVQKEFGYLVPGDAIALVKLSFTIEEKDQISYNSIIYEVVGIADKKTHKEIALKKMV